MGGGYGQRLSRMGRAAGGTPDAIASSSPGEHKPLYGSDTYSLSIQRDRVTYVTTTFERAGKDQHEPEGGVWTHEPVPGRLACHSIPAVTLTLTSIPRKAAGGPK